MTQLLLEIPHRKDLDLLLALAERLNIRIVQKDDLAPAKNDSQEPTAAAHLIVKPLRKKLRIADLKNEQNYRGMNQARLDRLIDELDVQEPITLLLAQLRT